MEEESRKKEVKQIVYLLVLVWILNIAIWAYVLYSGTISFDVTSLIGLSPLILDPFVIIGLWSFKKWGLILGYILSLIIIINSLISVNIIGIIIWAIVLFYLYKARNVFS